MFVIKAEIKNYYFQNKKRIILFETYEEANYFLEGFMTYSMQRMMVESPFRIPEIMNLKLSIIEPDFDLTKQETVNSSELY